MKAALSFAVVMFLLAASVEISEAQIFNSGTGYTNSVTPVAGSPWTYGTVSSPASFTATEFDTNYYYTVDSSYNGVGTPTFPPGDDTTLIGLGNYANDSRVQYDPNTPPILAGSETLPSHEVTLRQDSGSSVLDPFARFTASTSVVGSVGELALAVSFIPADLAFNSNTSNVETFSIVLDDPSNGVTTLYSSTLVGDGLSDQNPGASYTGTVNLAAGDMIDFVESGVNNVNSTTTLDATLTAIPEPATWACLLVGLGWLFAMARGVRPAGCRG